MEDHFAALDLPRLPWIDAETARTRFLELSADVHPDRFHNASSEERESATRRYADLNAAQTCLSSAKSRLLHLIELERGSRPEVVRNVPEATMDTFLKVGQLTRDVDAFIEEKSGADSPLIKAALFQRGLEWTDRLQSLQGELNAELEPLNTELRALNAAWETAPPIGSPERVDALPLHRLEEISRVVSHLSRWSEQLQDRIVRLSF
jgi:DnaJ-domain-containing protein 1